MSGQVLVRHPEDLTDSRRQLSDGRVVVAVAVVKSVIVGLHHLVMVLILESGDNLWQEILLLSFYT